MWDFEGYESVMAMGDCGCWRQCGEAFLVSFGLGEGFLKMGIHHCFRHATQTTRGTRLMMGMASVVDPDWVAMSSLEDKLGTK